MQDGSKQSFVAFWVGSKLHFCNKNWHFTAKMVKKVQELIFVTLCTNVLDLLSCLIWWNLGLKRKMDPSVFGSGSRSSLRLAKVLLSRSTDNVGNCYFQEKKAKNDFVRERFTLKIDTRQFQH